MRSTAIKDLLEGLMSASGAKAYPVMVPQGQQLPAVAYQRVGGSGDPTFETSGLQKVRLQVDVYAPTALKADELRDELREALDGYSGTLSDGTVLQNVDHLQPLDYFENFVQNYRCGAEYYFYFNFSS